MQLNDGYGLNFETLTMQLSGRNNTFGVFQLGKIFSFNMLRFKYGEFVYIELHRPF